MRAWLDASASTTRPPAGVETQAAAYGLLGLRAELDALPSLTLGGRGHGGAGIRAQDGRWLFGEATARWVLPAGPLLGVIDAGAFLLRYDRPYDYRARAVRLEPGVSLGAGRFRLLVAGDLARGDWRSRYPDPGTPLVLPTAEIEADGALRVDGARASLSTWLGRIDLELAAAVRDAINGTVDGQYRSAELGGVLSIGPGSLLGTLHLQDTPDGGEAGGELGALLGLGRRATLVALLSRPVTDPLYGTRSGVGVSLGASLRLHAIPQERGLAVIGPPAEGRRLVTIRVRHPAATAVEVAGSFNGWVPVAMRRSGRDWTLTLHLAPGSYTFAFRLPDGTWFVPDDAPGIVDDGFGQRNATLVVPPL